jgi:hypothetical protein
MMAEGTSVVDLTLAQLIILNFNRLHLDHHTIQLD